MAPASGVCADWTLLEELQFLVLYPSGGFAYNPLWGTFQHISKCHTHNKVSPRMKCGLGMGIWLNGRACMSPWVRSPSLYTHKKICGLRQRTYRHGEIICREDWKLKGPKRRKREAFRIVTCPSSHNLGGNQVRPSLSFGSMLWSNFFTPNTAYDKQLSKRDSLNLFLVLMKVTILQGKKKKETCTSVLFLAFTGKHTQRQWHNKLCLTGAELLITWVSLSSHYLYTTPRPFQQQAKHLSWQTQEYKINLIKKATEHCMKCVKKTLCRHRWGPRILLGLPRVRREAEWGLVSTRKFISLRESFLSTSNKLVMPREAHSSLESPEMMGLSPPYRRKRAGCLANAWLVYRIHPNLLRVPRVQPGCH